MPTNLPRKFKGATGKEIRIANPLIIVFEQYDEIVCRLHLRDSYTHQHYGMLVCDVVRNIADAFNVHEDDVWQVVDHERRYHTSDIKHPS